MDASKDRASNTDDRNSATDNESNSSPSSPPPANNIAGEQTNNEKGNGHGNASGGDASGSGGLKRKSGSSRNRCDKCGKKLGLTGAYACRCGGKYCAVHRYSFQHECDFDYRALGAEQIRRENPVVSGEKIRKF